jgi:hypothetical protein
MLRRTDEDAPTPVEVVQQHPPRAPLTVGQRLGELDDHAPAGARARGVIPEPRPRQRLSHRGVGHHRFHHGEEQLAHAAPFGRAELAELLLKRVEQDLVQVKVLPHGLLDLPGHEQRVICPYRLHGRRLRGLGRLGRRGLRGARGGFRCGGTRRHEREASRQRDTT